MTTFALSHVGARVYNSANISIPDTTLTKLTFDSERYDNDSIHSTVSNTGRLTCQTAGKYIIGAHTRWDANATGIRLTQIFLNNATQIGTLTMMTVTGGGVIVQSVVTVYDLVVGDYVEVRVQQTSGGPLNVTATGNHSPEFWMQRIG